MDVHAVRRVFNAVGGRQSSGVHGDAACAGAVLVDAASGGQDGGRRQDGAGAVERLAILERCREEGEPFPDFSPRIGAADETRGVGR